ncbi:MAG: hypothetical protein AAB730_01825 [Patescibacteria group bacterium]
MPKHKPIRFRNPRISEEIKERLKAFIAKHPYAGSTAKAVIATALLGGILTTAVVAPGAVGALGKYLSARKKARNERYRKLWERFYALKKQNIFEYVGDSPQGELIYRFSDKGRVVMDKFLMETLEIEFPARWDGKWRVVVFDIPEKYKKTRRSFQTKLSELGFFPLQKSVWVYPFHCEPEIKFLKNFLNIEPHVEIFVTETMPNGKVLYNFRKLLREYI